MPSCAVLASFVVWSSLLRCTYLFPFFRDFHDLSHQVPVARYIYVPPRTIYDARPNSTTRSTGTRGRALSLHSSFAFTPNERCTLCTVWMCDILGHRCTLDISSFDIRYINVLLALLNLMDIAFFVHT